MPAMTAGPDLVLDLRGGVLAATGAGQRLAAAAERNWTLELLADVVEHGRDTPRGRSVTSSVRCAPYEVVLRRVDGRRVLELSLARAG